VNCHPRSNLEANLAQLNSLSKFGYQDLSREFPFCQILYFTIYVSIFQPGFSLIQTLYYLFVYAASIVNLQSHRRDLARSKTMIMGLKAELSSPFYS
jgi:hypothetical protein